MNDAQEETERPQPWIFTFGYGQHGGALKHCFVRITGTFVSAREEMERRYGRKWSMQYASEEEAGVKRFGLVEIQ